MNLASLPVLTLDCQATGAASSGGHLLEMGWVVGYQADMAEMSGTQIHSYPIALPKGVTISRAVQRVTGFGETTAQNALAAIDVWQMVVTAARRTAELGRQATCPTVIHYARFEAPFLNALHDQAMLDQHFPLLLICTHAIAQRLLPDLPRRSLRALAGYLGHGVPPMRRSADHAVATTVIWHHLVRRLRDEVGIERLDQLSDWLRTRTPASTGRRFPMPCERRRSLPAKPGVYRFYRSNEELLYVGKARSLKQRVNSYFGRKGGHGEHILEMISQAAEVKVACTDTALEAALLESDEIKRLSPPYNIALQERQRQLLFGAHDLLGFAAAPDPLHPIGPLPDGYLTNALAAFGRWMALLGESETHTWLESGYALTHAEPEALDPAILIEGMALFADHFLGKCHSRRPVRVLTQIGAVLWRAHLVAGILPEEISIENKDTEKENPAPVEPEWTPGRVMRRIEGMAQYSAHAIRRSRWLTLLCESTVAWGLSGARHGSKAVLSLENGQVVARETLPTSADIQVPNGFAKSHLQRLSALNLPTYDRLRVLTTELRRLVTEDRPVEIRLRRGRPLRQTRLLRLLLWI